MGFSSDWIDKNRNDPNGTNPLSSCDAASSPRPAVDLDEKTEITREDEPAMYPKLVQ